MCSCEFQHTVQFRSCVTSAWKGIGDYVPGLKGQRHQEIMDFLEIWSHHGCEEEEEGRESVGSRVCPRTILERGAARGIARLPPCTNAARGTREKHVLIRNQSLSGVSLLDC